MKHVGILKRIDAVKWKHWWTLRGHSAEIISAGRRDWFHCYLRLK